jgi:hypothetical protein
MEILQRNVRIRAGVKTPLWRGEKCRAPAAACALKDRQRPISAPPLSYVR